MLPSEIMMCSAWHTGLGAGCVTATADDVFDTFVTLFGYLVGSPEITFKNISRAVMVI